MEMARTRILGAIKVSLAAAMMSLALFVGMAFAQAPSQAQAATYDKYLVTINVKDYGTISVELDRNAAPKTVDHFVSLVQKGFYNGSTFHRIVKDFVIQGGQPPKGTAEASTIKGEFAANGWHNPISHARGTISMARAGDEKSGFDTASSEFFIVQKTSTYLDGNYAAFGHVVSGMDVVDAIANVYTVNDSPIFGAPEITSITVAPSAPKTGWAKSGSKWWYKYDTATKLQTGKSYPRNEFLAIDGKWYAFDSSGYMRTGWAKISNKWYYFGSDGARKSGWQKVGATWYLLDGNGVMLTGWQKINDVYYYLSSSGAMKTGWLKSGGKWYYLNSSGAMLTGTVFSDGNAAYMVDFDGAMLTGKQKANDDYYYFASNGAMKSGWFKDKGKWYYFSPAGPMLKNRWVGAYWVGSDGAMATNAWVNNNKFYVGSNGAWQSGWTKVDGKWYFITSSGKVTNRWVGSYWLGSDGAMAINAWVDNGRYYVGSNGIWVPNAKKTSSSSAKSSTTQSTSSAATSTSSQSASK